MRREMWLPTSCAPPTAWRQCQLTGREATNCTHHVDDKERSCLRSRRSVIYCAEGQRAEEDRHWFAPRSFRTDQGHLHGPVVVQARTGTTRDATGPTNLHWDRTCALSRRYKKEKITIIIADTTFLIYTEICDVFLPPRQQYAAGDGCEIHPQPECI